MKKHVQFIILAGLVVGLASLPAFGVQSQQASPQQGQQASGSQTTPAAQGSGQQQAAAPAVDPAEEKAYKDLYGIQRSQPEQVVKSGEAFLKKYPNSRYDGAVYAILTPAYQQLNDATKMFDAGRKALKVNPDDVDILSLMAYSLPRHIDPNDLESTQQLQEAAQDANHALDLLSKMQKPANLTEEQFTSAINAVAATCHSGLGLVEYYQHNIPGMVSEFEQAVKLDTTPDPGDQYLLGLAYIQDGRPTDAVAILQKCAAEPGPLVDRCKASITQAQKLAASQSQSSPKQ